jgi:hypothetical protein
MNETIIKKVVEQICKTRCGRKKVFSNFRWDTQEYQVPK